MPIDLYHSEASPFCRSVRLTARAVGCELNLIPRNIHEHNPDIQAINPQHTIPTIVDGDVKLWESRAIMTYLANKYAKNDLVYPKDPAKRAEVDRLLYFDCGTLNERLWLMMVPVFHKKAEKAAEEDIKKFRTALGYLETFLEGKQWVAGGNHYTLADIALAVTLSGPKEGGLPLSKYPNTASWMTRCENELPGYQEINVPGQKALASRVLKGSGLEEV